MSLGALDRPLVVVVGGGGVGKTTFAAALGLASAREGTDTLVMTFDPSERLKDALGVGAAARGTEVRVACDTPGRLDASLLDPRATFDRLIRRYAPDEASCRRILENRFYRHLGGSLAGILEYMAVERLFEVDAERRYGRVILDTPPTRQALDFLEAPDRMLAFLESGALKVALRRWFDDRGRLRATAHLAGIGRGVEALLDHVVGLDLLRDMAEFFQIWAPLYDGFKGRARTVQALLRAKGTVFVLVTGPGEERIADALFFARRLGEAGMRLGPIVVNRVHPAPDPAAVEGGRADPGAAGLQLFAWLAARDARGLARLRGLLSTGDLLVALPLLARAPTSLEALEAMGSLLLGELAAAGPARPPRRLPRRGKTA
ncbi:MAG TPA: ArsA-related P-loop ATPase [Gemmatimonadales bacterium]|nr:ArsA-related P-loop ATPase [Gemmatimonadales bacterium]